MPHSTFAVPARAERTACGQSRRKMNQEMAGSLPASGPEAHCAILPPERAQAECSQLATRKIAPRSSSPSMRPKKVILCVDDNEQDLSVLKFMLTTNGYRVVSASNGQEAIDLFAKTAVDLVLADFGLPQMNGSQLVERLKQMASHVPMILLGDPQRMAGEMHAADALMAKKNYSPHELLERIKVMSARKRGPRKGSQRMVPVVELAVAS
jgi:CheY-like chemotaxis protein